MKTQKQIKRPRKIKYCVVNEHDNYELDKESGAYVSTDDNNDENEHNSDHENGVDDDDYYHYFTPVRKRRNNKNVYAKKIKQ